MRNYYRESNPCELQIFMDSRRRGNDMDSDLILVSYKSLWIPADAGMTWIRVKARFSQVLKCPIAV